METLGRIPLIVQTISLTVNIDFEALKTSSGELFEKFGNTEAGFWEVEVYNHIARSGWQHVKLYLTHSDKDKRAAEFSAVVLNKNGRAMKNTRKVCEVCFFKGVSREGWDEFLGPLHSKCIKNNYLVDNKRLRLKIIVKVYPGFFYDESLPGILQIVQRRFEDDKDVDSSDDVSALPADDNDNQSTVNPRKLPPSGGSPDASSSSSLSHPPGVETKSDENGPRCIVPGRVTHFDLSKFAADPRTYDVTIICQGRKFLCHRFILAARSKIFTVVLYGEFAESKQSEIEINDIPSECVEEFLTFLATDTCSSLKLPLRCQCGDATVCSGNDVCRYVRGKDALYHTPRLLNLLTAADKYQVPELSSKCIQALARCICYRTVLDVLDRAETLQCKLLIDACWHYINNCKKVGKIVKKLRRRLQASSS